MPSRSVSDRGERRDVPSGQERSIPLLQRIDVDIMERRNDPSGRERSLPPQQSRNDPSGEERSVPQILAPLELSETREVPGRGNEIEEPIQQGDNVRQILGGVSPNESTHPVDDNSSSRVVTGSQEVMSVARKCFSLLRSKIPSVVDAVYNFMNIIWSYTRIFFLKNDLLKLVNIMIEVNH